MESQREMDLLLPTTSLGADVSRATEERSVMWSVTHLQTFQQKPLFRERDKASMATD